MKRCDTTEEAMAELKKLDPFATGTSVWFMGVPAEEFTKNELISLLAYECMNISEVSKYLKEKKNERTTEDACDVSIGTPGQEDS